MKKFYKHGNVFFFGGGKFTFQNWKKNEIHISSISLKDYDHLVYWKVTKAAYNERLFNLYDHNMTSFPMEVEEEKIKDPKLKKEA